MRKKRVFVELVQSHRTYMELQGHIRSCPRAKWQPAHSNTMTRAVRDQSINRHFNRLCFTPFCWTFAGLCLSIWYLLVWNDSDRTAFTNVAAGTSWVFFYIVSENSYNFIIFRQFTDETVDQKWSSHKSLLEKIKEKQPPLLNVSKAHVDGNTIMSRLTEEIIENPIFGNKLSPVWPGWMPDGALRHSDHSTLACLAPSASSCIHKHSALASY